MYDQRGIKRSYCTDCIGEEQCSEFEKSDKTPFCGYCGCPPIKHKRVALDNSINTEPSVLTDKTSSGIHSLESEGSHEVSLSTTSFGEMEHSSNLGNIAETSTISLTTKGYENLNASIPELPQFSKCVQNALCDGTVNGILWSNMIMQCAMYYAECPQLTTKTGYDIVGRRMFDQYPCIQGPGFKPWTHFTKCLSQRIRTERLKRKGFAASLKKKNFKDLHHQKEDASHSNQRVAASDIRRTFRRSDANIPSTISEVEILETRKKISSEWVKQECESALIKSYLRDTFSDRTALLENGISFDKFIEIYPCFKDADYLIYEFGMLLGKKAMQELGVKMKDFFIKLQSCCHKSESAEVEGDIMLLDWFYFEKKCGVFQTKAEKSAPIIQVVGDNAEYQEKLQFSDVPVGVLLQQNGKIIDCSVVYGAHFIQCPKKSIISLLLLLLATYYSLELNYPKRFLQAMGAFAHYVLQHNFYKLGSRAIKMLRVLQ